MTPLAPPPTSAKTTANKGPGPKSGTEAGVLHRSSRQDVYWCVRAATDGDLYLPADPSNDLAGSRRGARGATDPVVDHWNWAASSSCLAK